MTGQLSGLRILVLEDEFLIAMDVEQLCRDHGADDVAIARSLGELEAIDPAPFDAAIVDVMLGGASTLGFARELADRGVPFVFASGYTELKEMRDAFPSVEVVGKPYAGNDLIDAISRARATR